MTLPDNAVIVIAWPVDSDVPTVDGKARESGDENEILAIYEKWQLREALWAYRNMRAVTHAPDKYEQAGLGIDAEPAPQKGAYDD